MSSVQDILLSPDRAPASRRQDGVPELRLGFDYALWRLAPLPQGGSAASLT